MVAFGIRHLGCVRRRRRHRLAQPAADNGYKVYLGDGSQIVPPADAEIAAQIERGRRARLADVPRTDASPWLGDGAASRPTWTALPSPWSEPRPPRAALGATPPMHGVGGERWCRGAVAGPASPPPAWSPSRQQPDPDFPTVAFPNPEEPGAIDLALALAERIDADLVVANDPDADRCAVAAAASTVDWRMLRGDELGALLGDDALRRGVRGHVRLLDRLQLAARRRWRPRTGSRSRHADRLQVDRSGAGAAFGYEEAIGYCVDPAAVPDKDGISALVRVLALAAELKAAGADRWRTGWTRSRGPTGCTPPTSCRSGVEDLAVITDAMAPPARAPAADARRRGRRRSIDLADGLDELPPTDAVRLAGRDRHAWWSGRPAPSPSSSATWRHAAPSRKAVIWRSHGVVRGRSWTRSDATCPRHSA